MCGIVGYIGRSTDIRIGMEALKRLEYRGYDSAGMAVYNKDRKEIDSVKAVGKVVKLEEKLRGMNLTGSPFLFYTRWATHGGVTEENCHPHTDCKQNIWVAHNGIIENYRQLKEELLKEGHVFVSETDTEVLPHLIEKFFKGNLEEATRKTLSLVRGAYALAIIAKDDPEKLVLARFSAPLLIGLGKNEYLAASDPSAVITHTNKVVYLEDGELAILTPESFSIQNYQQEPVLREAEEIDWDVEDAKKDGYPHFMQKEIMEQPESITNSLRGRLLFKDGDVKLGGLELVKDRLKDIERLEILACGTAYLSGLVGRYMLQEYAGIPTEADIASEFRYRKPIISKKTGYLFISQSGETADTLAAIQEVKKKGGFTLGIVNTVGSSIARETEAGVYNHAGPEIGVASTKAFTSQLTVLALLTLFLGRQRDMSFTMGQRITKELANLPALVKETLEMTNATMEKIAAKYQGARDFLFIARKYNYPVALEGALKLKEISYIHAEGYGAGEMKHGPLAMIDENFPTFALCPSDSVYDKMISNVEEIKARRGPVIALATKGNKEIESIADDVVYIPKTLEMLTPILSVIPLQLFAYYMGVLKGYDVDKPRNLAKSVTVE
ncbi:glutamine--fructose-6-phosphate transaminase (isomerizing) [Patescibacteria group bacterium]|nr:glutamine--fructose-6-phosphate transaminase (isomerizing) [Patescibacteria group bacterium]